ncbi:hypothetical protein BD410DRAFT_843546 [Rickenella mellea]|uniref:F-box domain-containing protein n=1 Tax=Rickenella mellea TaxID=50990 RepID=A0A4Y7PR69_9AGAM|nr:hypothetical protein BD410DRAFT_843546 [Rickenella mellea]
MAEGLMTSKPTQAIHCIPPELLAHIFFKSLPESLHPGLNQAPLSVSSVCKAWRRIAISTPSIWSNIRVEFNKGTMLFTYLSILKSWIPRSSNRGFSFILTWQPKSLLLRTGDFDVDLSEIGEVIDVLVENCAVWRNISVDAPEQVANFTSRLLSVIPEGTPRIQQISISTPEFPFAKLFTSPISLFMHLSISTCAQFTPSGSYVPLENLTTLSLQVNVFVAMELLSRSPRLQQATLELILCVGDTYPVEPIALSCLHALKLGAAPQGREDPEVLDLRFSRFLACLQCPALNTFHISFDYFVNSRFEMLDRGGVVDLLVRSGSPLRELWVHSRSFESFQQFLEPLTSLKHLRIPNNILKENKEFFCRLIHDHYSSTNCHTQLCPNLESLLITGERYIFADRAKIDVMDIRSIVDASAVESPIDARPLVLVVDSGILESVILPPGSDLEIVDGKDWAARRQDDLDEIFWCSDGF